MDTVFLYSNAILSPRAPFLADSTDAPIGAMDDRAPVPRKIIHCDCDCFYASVEMRDDPGPCAAGRSPSEGARSSAV